MPKKVLVNFGDALRTNANELHIDPAQSNPALQDYVLPQLLQDAVVRDGLTDEGLRLRCLARILGGGRTMLARGA